MNEEKERKKLEQIKQDYAVWWHNEGSGMRPFHDEDIEEFANRITEIAWMNGAYKHDNEK